MSILNLLSYDLYSNLANESICLKILLWSFWFWSLDVHFQSPNSNLWSLIFAHLTIDGHVAGSFRASRMNSHSLLPLLCWLRFRGFPSCEEIYHLGHGRGSLRRIYYFLNVCCCYYYCCIIIRRSLFFYNLCLVPSHLILSDLVVHTMECRVVGIWNKFVSTSINN